MITSISNNIGIPQISLQCYKEAELVILNGKFEVDPTNPEWLIAEEMVFEFPEQIMEKSCCSQAYLKDSDPGVRYSHANRGTVLRSYIKGNKLTIEKITYFDAHGPLTFYLCSAYMKGGQRGSLVKSGYVPSGISNQPEKCTLERQCLMVKDGYVFGLYIFRQFYGQDKGLQVDFDIIGMPTDVDVDIPIIYADPSIDAKGSPIGEGHISGGHFSCTNPDALTFYANVGTWIMFFAVRTPSADNQGGAE